MSLFEWLGEGKRPHSLGAIESAPDSPKHSDPSAIKLRGGIACALILGAVLFSIVLPDGGVRSTGLALGGLAAYLWIAYRFRPKPDMTNVGWAGGLVDQPFRWSDDANRFLLVLRVLLAPGRFVSVSLRELVWYLRGRRFIILPPSSSDDG